MTVYGNGAFDSPRIGPLEIMTHVQQQGEMGRRRGEQSYLGRLFSQAMTASPEQQGGLTSLMARVSPDAAMSAQNHFQQQQDRQRQLLTEKARVMRTLSPERRAAIWPNLRSEMVRADPSLSTLPEAYDPVEFDPVIDHYANLGAPEGPKVVGAGGALVSPDGTPLFQNPHKPPNPWAPQPIPVPDGQGGTVLQVFDPNTRSFSPYRGDGQQPPPVNGPAPQGQGGGNPGFVSESFAPVANAMIAAGIPADQVDAILVNAAKGSPGVQVGGGSNPRLGYAPPKTGQGAVTTLTPDEVKAAGFPPGSVIQRKPDGSLLKVFSPTERDTNGGRALPGNVVAQLTTDAEKLNNLSDLSGSFRPEFAGNVVGGSAENLAGRLGGERIGLASRGQAQWWQQYDRHKNVIRNELFGSALTPSEQAAFEAADITPNMDPNVIAENLRLQSKLIERALNRRASVWEAQGYNPGAIGAAVRRDNPGSPVQAMSDEELRKELGL